ncbi:hypothetical protein [Chroogloeocystis siderophila]|jgi:hypothetical protein|uniref:Uncharacterized protein n=1 Tax=Chroogloeocystis siderophila 5.2 s.c.1 TaxID=247279 RepID=A0A1U7HX36_9CHRO|nr:hypothetical protein [Chroogloeocystis siderophila]OKH28095.1 hypothetical protein NIES1031_05850 [Chroogloeocystis siderophila 5.2 s.c.1]
MAQADLDTTISALQGGLTSIPAEAALANIESWQEQLKDAAPEIASALGELKSQLASGNASGIAQALKQVGSKTTEAAASAGGEAGTKVQQLGQMLTQAGNSIS